MMDIMDVALIALFIEAVVNALKPIWTAGEKKMTVSEYVSMGIGILLAVTCRIDMLGYVVELEYPFPEWVQYIFYALTGIAIGRGTNFLYDLWNKLKEWKNGSLIANGFVVADDSNSFDLEITHWSLAQLKEFCHANLVPCEGCVTREDYIEAIEQAFSREKAEPPEAE